MKEDVAIELENDDELQQEANIQKKTYKLIRPISKQEIQGIFGELVSLSDIFNDEKNPDESEKIINDFNLFLDSINKINKKTKYAEPIPESDMPSYDKLVSDFYNKMEKKVKDLKLPEGSFRKKTIDAFMRSIRYRLDGTYQYLMDKGITEPFKTYSVNTFLDYPTPRFKVGEKLEGRKKQNVYQWDVNRYEKYMPGKGFLEQYQIYEDYMINVQILYYKAKDAGKVDELAQKQFKKATYDALLMQKSNLEKLKTLKYEGDTAAIYPFSHSKMAFEGNWAGARHADPFIKDIDRKLKLLDNGWNAEDLPFIDSLLHVMGKLNAKGSGFKPGEQKEYQAIFNEFMNSHIDKHIDRRRLINMVRPLFKKYEDLSIEDSKTKLGTETKDVSQTKILEDTLRRKNVDIIHMNSDERERSNLINSLSDYLTDLNAQHRGSLKKHKDSDEIDLLKKKIIEVLKLLNTKRDVSIYEDERFKTLFKEVKELADAYIKAKRGEYERELEAKNRTLKTKKQAELNKRLEVEGKGLSKKELAKLQEKINGENLAYQRKLAEDQADKIKAWRPGTKMGKTRFESALNLFELGRNMETGIGSQKKLRDDMAQMEAQMSQEGYSVTNMEDFGFMVKRPYEVGLNCITNYYGTDPVFIREHCSRPGISGMYSVDEFKTIFKPIKVEGVTSDEFAAVAYAAVLNHDNISDDYVKMRWETKSPEIKKEDILNEARTMYTLDMAKQNGVPRAGMASKFLPWTLVPAKEKAKEAIEAYNKGDKTKLADILAVGIKEVNNECIRVSNLKRSQGLNFAYSSAMLKKMFDFAAKDPELDNMVQKKLGKETILEVQDSLRIKKFMDECYDAERKLQKAANEGIHLSKQEKTKCINAIVRFEFIATMHDKNRLEQVEDNEEIKEFRKPENYNDKMVNPDKYGLGPLDIPILESKLVFRESKPVYSVNKKLRTKAGMDSLNEYVKKATKGIDASHSEKDLIKDIKKCTDGIEKTAKTMRARALARIKAFDEQRAELEKKANQKKNNQKDDINKGKPKGLQ